MRSIGTLPHENEARKFTAFLQRQGIEASCDMTFEPATGTMFYTIWVHDEDQIQKAEAYLAQFLAAPNAVQYEMPETPPPVEKEVPIKRASHYITTGLMALCFFIFILNWPEQLTIIQLNGPSAQQIGMTPIEEKLLIDVPQPLAELDQLLLTEQRRPSQAELEQIAGEPFWQGAYPWLIARMQGKDTERGEGPLLEKVRGGEVWRLFTPCLLHRDFLHILFNMIWLWILGRPIEHRIGAGRTLALTLIAGVGSNLAQYLVSGPLFLGYSGVITGLAGFIWMREKVASWEGYPIHRSTLLFLAFFVIVFFLLQLGSFLIQLAAANIRFDAGIANTAHIAGALLGIGLGKLSFFKARVVR